MKVFVALSLLTAVVATSAAGAPPELLQSRSKAAPMTNGVVYRASLFSPQVLVRTTRAGWEGGQHVQNGYHWLQLNYRGNDPTRGGGMNIVSAPASRQSTATTVRILRTERASSPSVGIRVGPVVAVTLHGMPAQRIDGIVTGPAGHTFVAFSGKSGGASEAAGDHFKLLHNDLFRIIVTTIRGTPVVFFLDAGGAPKLNAEFLVESSRLVDAMKFRTG
jgi:hypothetical protein